MSIELDISGIQDAVDATIKSIEKGVGDGLIEAARVVADQAKAQHPYTDRTGDLTSSITPLGYTTGSLSGGDLETTVVALEPYAGYVEAKGFAFLEPAFDAAESTVESTVVSAIETALK